MADDLTGANDSGVQLSKRGLKTTVYLDALNWRKNYNAESLIEPDVLVIDTETREMLKDQAGQKIKQVIQNLALQNEQTSLFYKKIDSTLRGNVGREIEILMDLLKKDLCVLVPSFPGNNRITAGGYLLVNNEPLGISQYYSGELAPWAGTYIPHYVQQQTNLPVGLVELKNIMKGERAIFEQISILRERGKRIIVFDAVTEQDLKMIMDSTRKISGSILYCGSAGLANFFCSPKVNSRREKMQTVETFSQRPVLAVIGTRNMVMEKQIEYLTARVACSYIKIDLSQVFKDEKTALEDYVHRALMALTNNVHLIVHPDPGYNQEGIIGKIIQEEKISFRKLEMVIRGFLSKLTANILKTAKVSNLILTGGDTAVGVCKELSINSLNIIREILPGIPMSYPGKGEYQDLSVITKAGGFGEEDTLYQIVTKLADYNERKVSGLEINRKKNE